MRTGIKICSLQFQETEENIPLLTALFLFSVFKNFPV